MTYSAYTYLKVGQIRRAFIHSKCILVRLLRHEKKYFEGQDLDDLWRVENIVTEEQFSILDVDIGFEVSEMEVIAWVSNLD